MGVGPISQVQRKSSRQTAATAGTVTLTSAATKGNLLVMLVGIASAQTDSPITAGTTAWTSDYNPGSQRIHAYSKVADGGETALTHTVGASATFSTHAYEYAFPGHATPGGGILGGDQSFTVATASGTVGPLNVTDTQWVALAIVAAGGSIVAGSPVWSNSFANGEAQTEVVSAALIGTAANASLSTAWGTWTTSRTGNMWIGQYRWNAMLPRNLASLGVS